MEGSKMNKSEDFEWIREGRNDGKSVRFYFSEDADNRATLAEVHKLRGKLALMASIISKAEELIEFARPPVEARTGAERRLTEKESVLEEFLLAADLALEDAKIIADRETIWCKTREGCRNSEQPQQEQTAEKSPNGYKPNPLYVETKSRRLHLLVTPALFEKMKAEADRRELSVNALANEIFEEWLNGGIV